MANLHLETEPFSTLLYGLYRAASELPADEFHEAILGLLKEILPFDSSMWGAGSTAGGSLTVHSLHLHEQPDQLVHDWLEISHEDTVIGEVTAKLGRACNVHTPTLFRAPGKRAIRNFAERYGARNGLVICSAQADLGLFNWISLYRADDDSQFSPEHERALELLWPHIVQSLTLNRRVTLQEIYPSRAGSCLAIADRHGVVHHAEPAFETVVRSEWGEWKPPVLPRRLVEAMHDLEARCYRGSAIDVEFRKAADLFFVKARRRSALDTLGPRERQVALHYAKGKSYKEIARALNTSPETVRKQIQSVYRKLQVGDKGELATLLAGAGETSPLS